MFLILLKYSFGLDIINQHVEAHRVFLDKYYRLNKFICSGAQKPRTGGVILCKATSKQEVESIIAEDPFYVNHAAEYEIIEFEVSKYTPTFEPIIK